MLIRFWRDDRAATAVEYCFVAGLISIGILAGARTMGIKLAADYFGKFGAGLS